MDAPEESDAQRRARERRERRQAKIAAQGASRLEAITSLSGRPAPAVEDAGPAPNKPAPAAATAPTANDTADPPEVDISEHYYEPAPRRLPPSTGSSGTSTPFGRALSGGTDSPADDPMMRMMQQMLQGGGGGAGGAPGAGGAQAGDDPMLKMMQAMMGMPGGPGDAQQQQQQQQTASSSAYVWRIVHAVFSFGLAAYIAATSTFNGSKLSRSQSVLEEGGGVGKQLFYIFATAEVVLQTSRFFLEKGRLQQGGIMGTLGTVLPEPFAGYVRLVGRYSVIYTTVVADAMVVVFVLGVMAWWKGLVVS